MIECWHCDECNEFWAIQRANDGWAGECPTCGQAMQGSTKEDFDDQPTDEAWVPEGEW